MSNIEKIKKMVMGIYDRPIQVGYKSKTDIERKEGEKWTDAYGRNWKIKDGKRKQITKIPSRGFDKCNDCEKLILKTIDQQTYNRMQRCYYCQIDFEVDLKAKNKWEDWVKEMEEKRWEAVLKEYEDEMKDMDTTSSPFDTKVAYALSNENIKKYNE